MDLVKGHKWQVSPVRVLEQWVDYILDKRVEDGFSIWREDIDN